MLKELEESKLEIGRVSTLAHLLYKRLPINFKSTITAKLLQANGRFIH